MRSYTTRLFLLICLISTFAIQDISIAIAQEMDLPPLKVVQIGDSYSAGNGARAENGRRNYYGVSGCFRSSSNWGNQFVEALSDTFSVTYINRACSGGVIDNILNNRVLDEYWPTTIQGCAPYQYPDEEENSLDLPACNRSLKPQIDAIDDSVDLVIMTMGGNDVKFAKIVEKCLVEGFRFPGPCETRVNDALGFADKLHDPLLDAFKEIRAKLKSDARVIFVSYPHLVPDSDLYILNKITKRKYDLGRNIRELGDKGEAEQKKAIADANQWAVDEYGEEFIVVYDGTKVLFAEHLLDPTEENNPVAWFHAPYSTRFISEWYHFNPEGHESLAKALSPLGTFGVPGQSFKNSADIDIAFVVDTTGSMRDEISDVQNDMGNLVNLLASLTDSYRVAIVTYRDAPEHTGKSSDYAARVDLSFTNDLNLIQDAIDSLSAYGGGDSNETVFSGIQAAIELPWRPGVTKIAMVVGDAPAHNPEQISGLTASTIVASSIAVDPVAVIGVDVGSLDSNGALGEVANGTGGTIVSGSSELTKTLSSVINFSAKKPVAWMGSAYVGRIGESITFDASGSYDPSGQLLSLYEWDFDADGTFDLSTTEETTDYTYDSAFNDYVVLRVTGVGGSSLASARTVINEQGSVLQGDEAPCELDDNGYSIIVDEDGLFSRCTAERLPEEDAEGIVVASPTSLDNDTQPPSGLSERLLLPWIGK